MAARKSSGKADHESAGFATSRAYYAARKRAKQWSAAHSRVTESRWNDSLMRDPELFRAYYDTYVSPVNSIGARRARGNKNPAPKMQRLLAAMSEKGLTDVDYRKYKYNIG